MLNRLKHYNDIAFIIFLIFLLGSSAWLFSHNLEEKISLLQNEVQKIDKQTLFFTKQNNDLINQRNILVDNISHYAKLEENISTNNTEELKKLLSENSKSSELLAILPPSEIANIQQKDNIKKINEDIVTFKSQAAFIYQSINKLNSEEFNNNDFVIGNIKDNNLKTTLSNHVSTLLKKEKPIFSSLANSNKDINNFSQTTENVKQFFPLLKSQQEQNKSSIVSVMTSLSNELYIVQIVSVVGLVCLVLLLFFVIFKKKTKTVNTSQHFNTMDNTTLLDQLQQPTIKTPADDMLHFFNTMNNSLSKHINLHFDTELFDTLPLDTKNKLTAIIQEFIQFSLLYSFDMRDFGDIIISVRDDMQHKKLIFKDNGKGLVIDEIKNKIKQQYGVSDSAFAGKSEQQILSLIFKPNFNFLSSQSDSTYHVNLSSVTDIIKQLNAQLSIKNHEHNGIEFVILF